MKRLIYVFPLALLFAGCGQQSDNSANFEVKGTITNPPFTTIYLEQVPMANMQPAVVDSAKVGKDGKYVLRAETGEAMVYNLRLAQSQYPMASVINDTSSVTVDVVFSKENSQFPDSYEVKGSKASQVMKDFMLTFNTRLQTVFSNEQKRDSLQANPGNDSAIAALNRESAGIAAELRKLLDDKIAEAENPALTMILVGYYQGTANNVGPRLQALSREDVVAIVEAAAAKFPAHQGLASVKGGLEGWIGKTAPEIALPDKDGREVKLSSFRGKYVLVDFWASWCGPCRMENPNVVAAYAKFKNRNFTILGVSLDKPGQREKWLQAIADDKLTWTHVSDLKFWESPVVPLYKIEGIPYNVLLDPAGKIIAENLRGAELEKKLGEVLP
jgi:peroxiredoxin